MSPGLTVITGGTGTIGQLLARRFHDAGMPVRIASRTAPASAVIDWRPLDVTGGDDQIEMALAEAHTIIHLAAHIPRDHEDLAEALECWKINAMGTHAIVQALARAGGRRMIMASTANLYAPHLAIADEDSPFGPVSRVPYLASKAAQEWWAASACRKADLRLAILRISSVYGGGSSTLDTMAGTIARNQPVRIQRDALYGADFIYRDDVVDAFMLACLHDLQGAFNVSTGVRTPLADVARLLVAAMGAQDRLLELVPGDGSKRDIGFAAASSDKLRHFGFSPRSLASGLDKLAEQETGRGVLAARPIDLPLRSTD